MPQKQKIQRLLSDSYLALIRVSVGSKMFQKDFYLVKGKKLNVLEGGNLSCAFFVSAVLKVFDLIPVTHTTVKSAVIDMKKAGWRKITKPRIGCILVWEEKQFKNGGHRHIGFYMGNKKAISNNPEKRFPIMHHWTFGIQNGKPARSIEVMYWHNDLE